MSLERFALTGEQVLDEKFASRYGWTRFFTVYDGDEAGSTWTVVGERYVDLDRAPSYNEYITIVSGLDQVDAVAAERYLSSKLVRR